jgi:formyltetrahydrofolate deformylase
VTMTQAQPSAVPALPGRSNQAVLIVHGADRPGIVAAVSSTLAQHGANIVALDQYTDDPQGGQFFQRTVFDLPDLIVNSPALEADLEQILGKDLGMTWKLTHRASPKRVIILASKSDHCLLDLLWRHRRGEIPMAVPMVISNHPDMAEDVRSFGIPFFHVPSGTGVDKSVSERKIIDLITGNADLVVLARYMQILSEDFLGAVGVPVINIHHSFLPAFAGQNPHQEAYERGVKIIGASAHYVIEELDAGPIIAQDVTPVSHRESVEDLTRLGEDIERTVLARAVTVHLEDRTLVHENKTIVF